MTQTEKNILWLIQNNRVLANSSLIYFDYVELIQQKPVTKSNVAAVIEKVRRARQTLYSKIWKRYKANEPLGFSPDFESYILQVIAKRRKNIGKWRESLGYNPPEMAQYYQLEAENKWQ